jgi:hypothetical protein
MKKVRLNESDIENIVRKIIKEDNQVDYRLGKQEMPVEGDKFYDVDDEVWTVAAIDYPNKGDIQLGAGNDGGAHVWPEDWDFGSRDEDTVFSDWLWPTPQDIMGSLMDIGE